MRRSVLLLRAPYLGMSLKSHVQLPVKIHWSKKHVFDMLCLEFELRVRASFSYLPGSIPMSWERSLASPVHLVSWRPDWHQRWESELMEEKTPQGQKHFLSQWIVIVGALQLAFVGAHWGLMTMMLPQQEEESQPYWVVNCELWKNGYLSPQLPALIE